MGNNSQVVVLGDEGRDYVSAPITVAEAREQSKHLGVSDGHLAYRSGKPLADEFILESGTIVVFVS